MYNITYWYSIEYKKMCTRNILIYGKIFKRIVVFKGSYKSMQLFIEYYS